MKFRIQDLGLRFASALLMHHGEVSVEDIRAMPFFKNFDESEAVIKALQRMFNVEICTKKVTAWPIPQWKELIKLKE